MAVAKRKIETILGRRVRPRVERDVVRPARVNEEEEEEEEEFEGFGEDSGDRQNEGGEEGDSGTNNGGSDDDDNDDDSPSSPEEEPSASHDFANITFGQLARAQASLPPKPKKHASAPVPSTAEPLDTTQHRPAVAFAKRKPPPSRSNKHAPAEVSSKRAVKRAPSSLTATSSTKLSGPSTAFVPRDPRFDPAILARAASAAAADPSISAERSQRDYAFLDEYRAREVRDLRAKLRDKKVTQDEKDQVRRELASVDSRQRARGRQDLEKKVREDHRATERELAAQGKKPFFLKKAELKKRVLTEQFTGLSEKQAERAVERRRKKVAGKEKKELGQLERRR